MNMIGWIFAFDILTFVAILLFAREIFDKRSTSAIKADRRGLTALIFATILLILVIIAKPFPGRIGSIVLNAITLLSMLVTLIDILQENRKRTIDEESATYFGCFLIMGLFLYFVSLILRIALFYLPAVTTL